VEKTSTFGRADQGYNCSCNLFEYPHRNTRFLICSLRLRLQLF